MEVQVPGQIAAVDGDDRLSVPVDILREVPWWRARATEVIAELVRFGLVRIYSAEDAAPLVDSLRERSRASAGKGEEQFERYQTLADRYRPLKMYSDGRLRFSKEVAAALAFSLGSKPTLYVQAFPTGLEVMSSDFRFSRLSRPTFPLIGLHLASMRPA